MSDYRSVWLSLPNAVEADAPDVGVAGHYGEPILEQRWLIQGAVVDVSHRAVLSITGEQRLNWLDSISSQQLKGLPAGVSTETLILDPNGRIEHELKVLDDGITLWIIVEGSEAESLLNWLNRMKFRTAIEIVDRSAEFAVVGSMHEQSVIPVSAPNGVPLIWQDPWAAIAAGGWSYAQQDGIVHPGTNWSWREFIINREDFAQLPDRLTAAGIKHSGVLAVEALRAEAWRPRFAAEIDEKSIPHELDLLRSAVHLNKGCYRGQETVAKVHNLGRPPRRLTLLHLDGSSSTLPRPGAEIFAPNTERAIGKITTAAWHHELGPIALALIKRNVDSELVLNVPSEEFSIAASQEVIVPADAGATANIQIPRRRLL